MDKNYYAIIFAVDFEIYVKPKLYLLCLKTLIRWRDRKTFALSREAGNELKPEYNSGKMDGVSGECHSPEKEERSRIGSGITEEENRLPDGTTDERIYCADGDYETAEIIGNKMLLHMAAAYRMIDGDAQEVVPEIKPLDQRKVLFEQLKGEYSLGELINEAKSQGVSRSSAIRWNNQWIPSD